MTSQEIYIHADTTAKLLYVDSPAALPAGTKVLEANCPRLGERPVSAEKSTAKVRTIFDASALKNWTPNTPILYTLQIDNALSIRFGYSELRPWQNKAILLNGAPCYLRGYIRGIVAHDHPNMTGKSLKEAAVKNIRQAKKYGFNLVRFHSTIPTPEFVEAADEEGMLIHIEIGFAYERDEKGEKKNLSMDNKAWTETILKYRNSPSIAIFCIGNEMNKSGHYPEVKALYAQGRALACGKLILDNSGWGEFDRPTADVYSQHVAYFFPFKAHENMFFKEDPWLINGSAYDEPQDQEVVTGGIRSKVHRPVVPARPWVAHEAVHYIDVPDYEALNKKFDDFCAQVGPAYLEANGIKKPRFMTELPKLIARKGLTQLYPDYIKASQFAKMSSLKVYLEHCRLSQACGFEMLQFSDCLKYENKNGIVDCFDDDKYIPANWMMQFNGDIALLAHFDTEVYHYGAPIQGKIFISDFLASPAMTAGELTITLRKKGDAAENATVLYAGKNLTLVGGLQPVADLDFTISCVENPAVAAEYIVEGTFQAPDCPAKIVNSWQLWLYPQAQFQNIPATRRLAKVSPVAALLANSTGSEGKNTVLTDTLDDQLFADLEAGKHVILLYHRDHKANQYYFPGALERYKPCIWDRGSNLGGIIDSDELQKTLASGRYFDLNMYGLLEAGYKCCLDEFPVKVQQIVSGVDKPVRDRMKGIVQGVKDFIDTDTLRNFSHLFSVRVGKGLLTICTFALTDTTNPAVQAFLAKLCNTADAKWLQTDKTMELAQLQDYLKRETAKGIRKEDTMNHFWEIDTKLVEDTLFWEEAGLDLKKIN